MYHSSKSDRRSQQHHATTLVAGVVYIRRSILINQDFSLQSFNRIPLQYSTQLQLQYRIYLRVDCDNQSFEFLRSHWLVWQTTCSNIASKGTAESLLLSYIADDAYSIVMLRFDLLNSHLSEPCYRLLACPTVEGVAKYLLTNIACFRRCVVALPDKPFHWQLPLAQ